MYNGLSYFTHRSLDLGLEKGIILVGAAKQCNMYFTVCQLLYRTEFIGISHFKVLLKTDLWMTQPVG